MYCGWNVHISSKLFTAHRSCLQSHSPPPPTTPPTVQFFSAGLSPSTFHLICKADEFRSCFTLLPASTFLSAISSLICGHLLLRGSTLHLRVSGHFSYRWIRSPPSPIGGTCICPSPYRPSLQFPNSQPEPCYPAACLRSSYRRMCAALLPKSVSILRTVTRISSPSSGLAASVIRCQRIWAW